MHATANEIEIPTAAVERLFESAAFPGFTGSVTVRPVLRAAAACEIDLILEKKSVQSVRPEPAEAAVTIGIGDERSRAVRQAVGKFAPKFRLKLGLKSVTMHYKDGNPLKCETEEEGRP